MRRREYRDQGRERYEALRRSYQIEEGPFDYRTLEWEHADEAEPAEIEEALDEIEDLPKPI